MGEKPIGRRVALGVIGAGLTGIVFGAKVQDAMERVLGPITARDGTGLSSLFPVGRFRIYSVVGRLPERSDADYRLHVGGAVVRRQGTGHSLYPQLREAFAETRRDMICGRDKAAEDYGVDAVGNERLQDLHQRL